MTYKLSLKVKSYEVIGGEYQKVEATQKFVVVNTPQLAEMISTLASASDDELSIVIEKIKEEGKDE